MKVTIKKFLISILSLIFTISVLGTVTYAWFSIATSNVVHNLTLGISGENKFKISLDGVNFYDKLTQEDILNVIGKDLELKDVTTRDLNTFYKGGPEEFELAIPNVDYVSIVLYFRTTAAERNVYLVDNVTNEAYLNKEIDGTYVTSRGINWKADSTFINGPNPENDKVYAGQRYIFYAAEAVRISFEEVKIIENVNDNRDESDLNRKIFDLSRNSERGFGLTYGSLDYYNVKHNSNISPPDYKQDVVNILSAFEKYNPYIPKDNSSYICKLIETNKKNEFGDTYYIGKVIMNIWIEGWDADCFDAILRDKIIINLKFKGAKDLPPNNF